uniref:Putative secreted protein n=1 Tax=Ixodes ricinus TaxID=34613 RepID=A0A6B0U2G5_IXORI
MRTLPLLLPCTLPSSSSVPSSTPPLLSSSSHTLPLPSIDLLSPTSAYLPLLLLCTPPTSSIPSSPLPVSPLN